jgi:hypothetical protein
MLDHLDVGITMISMHVLKAAALGKPSALDAFSCMV